MNRSLHTTASLPLGFEAHFPLRWLEDETVFSLCSRYHRFSANGSCRDTSSALFGVRHGGHAHDFPSHLDALVERTCGAVGDLERLVEQHTIAPFYLPLRDQNARDLVLSSMGGDGIGSLKFRLGLLTSRFGASHPLKACPECAREDVAAGLPPYWRRSHQFPGVWICPSHQVSLSASTLKSTGVDRFGYHLPDEGICLQPGSSAVCSELIGSSVDMLGRACFQLGVTSAGSHFSPDRVQSVFEQGLIAHGFLSTSGRLRAQQASRSLSRFSEPFKLIGELSPLAVSEHGAYVQLCSLRRSGRLTRHPLRFIWLVTWLFSTWDRFLEAYEASDQAPDQRATTSTPGLRGTTPPSAEVVDKRSLCVRLICSNGFTPTRAAKEVGVATATAMSWAAAAGLTVSRRPKRLMSPDRQEAIQRLLSGASKAEVSDAFCMSASAVNLLLRTEPDLYGKWRSACHEQIKERHRQEWSRLIKSNPGAVNKVLRAQKPATYAWLYRNDRLWLVGHQSKGVRRSTNNASAVDWAARDKEFESAVDAWRSRLDISGRSTRAERRVALWEIYQAVPGLKSKLRRLKDLPRTQAAITRAIGAPSP